MPHPNHAAPPVSTPSSASPNAAIPFTTVPAQSLGYHTPGGGWGIDLFASQNFPPSPQIEAAKGLTPTREITPPLAFCVTNAPSPGRRVHRQVWVAFDDTYRPLPGRDFAPNRSRDEGAVLSRQASIFEEASASCH